MVSRIRSGCSGSRTRTASSACLSTCSCWACSAAAAIAWVSSCSAWPWRFRHDVPAEARFLLKAFGAASIIAVLLIGLTRGHTADLPRPLLVLMPNRLLNLDVLASVPLVFALLWTYRRAAFAAAGLVA